MFKKVYPIVVSVLVFFVIHSAQSMEKPNPIIDANKVCGSNMNDSFLSLSFSENSNDVETDDGWSASYYDDYIKENFLVINKENFDMIEAVFTVKEPLNIIEDYRNEDSVKKTPETKETTTQSVDSIWPTWDNVYSQAGNLVSELPGEIKNLLFVIAHEMQQPR